MIDTNSSQCSLWTGQPVISQLDSWLACYLFPYFLLRSLLPFKFLFISQCIARLLCILIYWDRKLAILPVLKKRRSGYVSQICNSDHRNKSSLMKACKMVLVWQITYDLLNSLNFPAMQYFKATRVQGDPNIPWHVFSW